MAQPKGIRWPEDLESEIEKARVEDCRGAFSDIFSMFPAFFTVVARRGMQFYWLLRPSRSPSVAFRVTGCAIG